jgi:PAS domain S-box-containing protein
MALEPQSNGRGPASNRPIPTGRESFFGGNDVIVSKTDTKGRITYANRVFFDISGYSESELLGKPHNIIRHPDMPRCVFKLLWDTLENGNEIFAYVKNLCKNGNYYWVHAHVTPTWDKFGSIIGYHSNRRVPNRAAVTQMDGLYRNLLDVEQSHSDWRQGMEAAGRELTQTLKKSGVEYDEFVFSLEA